MYKVSGTYKILTVKHNTFRIHEFGIENTVSTDRATKVPELQVEPGTNGDTHHARELSQTQTNEANNNYKSHFIVNNIARRVTENADTKYVVRCYWCSSRRCTVEPAQHLPHHFRLVAKAELTAAIDSKSRASRPKTSHNSQCVAFK